MSHFPQGKSQVHMPHILCIRAASRDEGEDKQVHNQIESYAYFKLLNFSTSSGQCNWTEQEKSSSSSSM